MISKLFSISFIVCFAATSSLALADELVIQRTCGEDYKACIKSCENTYDWDNLPGLKRCLKSCDDRIGNCDSTLSEIEPNLNMDN